MERTEPHVIKDAGLAALMPEALAVDKGNKPPEMPPEEAQPAAPQVDRTAEVAMLFGVLRPAVEMAFPYIKGAPDSEWQAMHEPVGELLNYYNVDVGEWIKSPWAKLAFAAMPLAMRGFAKWAEESSKKPDTTGAQASALVSGEVAASATEAANQLLSERA